MKKIFSVFLLIFLFATCFSQLTSKYRIENIDLTNNGEVVEITYDLISDSKTNKFNVVLEIRNTAKNIFKIQSLTGDINKVITSGTGKKIIWFPKKDGYTLKEKIDIKITAIPKLKLQTGKYLLQSFAFPGFGDSKIRKGKAYWLVGVLGYSLLASGIVMNVMAVNSYNSYLAAGDASSIPSLYNTAIMQRNISYGLLSGAAVVWSVDLLGIISKTKKIKKTITPVENKYYFEPQNESSMITANKEKFINTKSPYENSIDEADEFFNNKKYSEAKIAYLNAQKINPNEAYPQTKLTEINDILLKGKRDLPPNLYADLSFKDDNNNGILEAFEKARINVKISNQGKGYANELRVTVTDTINDKSLYLGSKEIAVLRPNESIDVLIPIEADMNIKTAQHKLKISVTEKYGFDMDPAFLVLNTFSYQPPQLEFSGFEIIDKGEGTGAIIEDGLLQAGEQVKVKIAFQNTGQSIANNVTYDVVSKDNNIYIDNAIGTIGEVKVGEVKEIWITLAPNKRVDTKDNLPIYLTLKEKIGKGNLENFQLPIALNQKPSEKKILSVKANVESLKKEIAKFEFSSKKFTTNVGTLIDIKNIEPSKTIRTNSVAVIFGIEKYDNLPPAPYASNDATLMQEYFTKRLGVEKVVIYKDKEVSGNIFKKVLNPDWGELQKAIIKGETELFVYYSGHGIPNKSGDKVYLFPSDGVVAGIEEFGYDLELFYENLNKLGAKTVTVILDACFSGSTRTSEKIQTENLTGMKGVKIKAKKAYLTNPNFTVINSSTGEETSLGMDAAESGLFTYFLCAGLQGKADFNGDRKITLGELKKYVTENVIETSKKISGLQTPEFYGNDEMILLEY